MKKALALLVLIAGVAWGQGPVSIPSAATITLPSALWNSNYPPPMLRITGTTEIDNITVPYTGFTGCVWVMPEGAWTTGTSGNILSVMTATAGQETQFCYNGTKWTVPIQGAAGAPATVAVTSTSSNTLGTGSQTFGYAAVANIGWTTGTRLRATADTTHYEEGLVTAVSSTSATILMDYFVGSGTYTSWALGLTGIPGTTGANGAATVTTYDIPPFNTASSTQAYSSLTTREVQLFHLPFNLTVNKINWWISTNTTTGTVKVCVYSEDGSSKPIDITVTPTGSTGIQTGTVSGVALTPGNYYMAIGCATTCSHTVTAGVVETTATMFGSTTPSGKKPYHGQVTHSSGTCNATLGTVTGGTDKPILFRLDN